MSEMNDADNEESVQGSELSSNVNSELIRRAYNQLAKVNGEINRMDDIRLNRKLRKYNLDTTGCEAVRKKRLKAFYKKVKLSNLDLYICNDLLPYYIILDFEATCEEINPSGYKHEIIEFPAVLVNSKTLNIEDTFRMICRPTIKTTLSPFCTELTGITQEEIDKASPFPQVLESFETWLQKHKLDTNFAVVTDGPWDMCRFLYVQCVISNQPYPSWGRNWINIRKVFNNFYGYQKCSLANMLEYMHMSFEGRPHCGLDDSKNIARILIRMICDGANIQPNETLHVERETTRSPNKKLTQDENGILLQLSQLDIEAKRMPIKSARLSTFAAVKKERLKFESKFARTLQGTNLDDDNSESECLPTESDQNSLRSGTPRFKRHKQKKTNRKGKLCH